MNTDRNELGSQWSIWDFHIHSPVSFEWSGQRIEIPNIQEKSTETLIKQCVDAMKISPASVFVIQDYWTFNGYHLLKEFLNTHPDLLPGKTILPGIELRIEAPANFRLNVHAIFSEKLTKQQLEDFRAKLNIVGSDRSLSEEAIQDYARSHTTTAIREKHGVQDWDLSDNKSALKFGSMIINVTKDSFKKAFETIPDDKGVIMMPWETSDGLYGMDPMDQFPTARELFTWPMIFETRKVEYVDAFLGRKTIKNQSFFDPFREALYYENRLAVSGSDAHKLSDYGRAINGKHTWIKAELTFNGLLQAIREPVCRSFIGEKPEKLINIDKNPSNFISSVKAYKNSGSNFVDVWFDGVEIPLSKDLVAIIGNKGSGKSALADIIALAGDTKEYAHFSFLNTERFRDPKKKWADHFSCEISWHDGEINGPVSLAKNPNDTAVERVKYIPQAYFEELCSPDKQESTDKFETELKQVIFSHVDESERQGHASLDSLLNEREQKLKKGISTAREELSSINEKIVGLENQLSETFKKTLEEQLAYVQAQLKTHDSLKPEKVDKPGAQLTQSQKDLLEQHTNLKQQISNEKQKLTELQAQKLTNNKKYNAQERIKQTIEQVEKYLESQKKSSEDDLITAGFSWNELITYQLNKKLIEEKMLELESVISESKLTEQSLTVSLEELNIKLEKISESLDLPNKKYQQYVHEINEWEEKRKLIVGSKEHPQSLEYLISELGKLEQLPEQIKAHESVRLECVKEIFDGLSAMQRIRKSMFEPVQSIINSHSLVSEDFDLTFQSSMWVRNLPVIFFEKIKRTSGTFSGEKEGLEKLDNLIKQFDLDKIEGVLDFTEALLDNLKNDKRTETPQIVDISKQLLKQGHTLQELYDFIFGLTYIEPRYSLLMNGTPVEKLSPGQRGALLLIFYLLVDRDPCPIILDQPEENLDNQTVYSLLVPVIKEAKNRRQVIMVTHNANLAVTCDAEQIIHANFDRGSKNTVTYQSGSIENPVMNNLVLDVLEGTKPAFKNRELKYRNSFLN